MNKLIEDSGKAAAMQLRQADKEKSREISKKLYKDYLAECRKANLLRDEMIRKAHEKYEKERAKLSHLSQ